MGNPYVTVVILTSGSKDLTSLMNALNAQTFKDFEIIHATEKGIVPAMNAALDRANGEIFVRIDDDVEILPSWLGNLIEPFVESTVAGATGPTFVPQELRKNRDSIRLAERPNWFLRFMFDNMEFAPAKIYKCGSVSYDSNYQEKFEFFGPFEPDHLEGTNWAMRTELIREVGGFDEKFDGVAEWYDTDVEAKIKKLGHRLIYNPRAYLFHMLGQGQHFDERFEGFGRIKNWLRYHLRHSKFHPKKLIWLTMMTGYMVTKMIRRK